MKAKRPKELENCKHEKTWHSSHYETIHKYTVLVELEKCIKCGVILNKKHTIQK